MNELSITYEIRFGDNRSEAFTLRLDASTLQLQQDAESAYRHWTELDHHRCPNCTLHSSSHPHCPAATSLTPLVGTFAHVLSYDDVRVAVQTDERSITGDMPAQRAISSLMGLLMAVSGCPIMAYFRPMARFHLPFASERETVYRAASMYLMAQLYLRQEGRAYDEGLSGLSAIYEQVGRVNRAFAERLRAASQEDSTVNALIILDTQAMTLPWAIDGSLDELRGLFDAYFVEPEQAAQ